MALSIIKMRLEQGLNQDQCAEKNGIVRTVLNRAEVVIIIQLSEFSGPRKAEWV